VVLRIVEDVVVPSHHRADRAQIGLKAGGERDSSILAEKFGELRFQLFMELERTIQES